MNAQQPYNTCAITESQTLSANSILTQCDRIHPIIKKNIPLAEYNCTLPNETVQALRTAGVFSLLMPKKYGGPACDPIETLLVIEKLSAIDPSVGWCAMIGCDSGFYANALDTQVAKTLFPQPNKVTAGWLSPIGQATPCNNGYNISGQWSFGSGIMHADIVTMGCRINSNDSNNNRHIIALTPRKNITILNTWDTFGLRGTGSHNYHCNHLFVPHSHCIEFTTTQTATLSHHRPDRLLMKMPAVPLGTALAALEMAKKLLRNEGKTQQHTAATIPSRERFDIREAIAHCECEYWSARDFVFSSVERYWAQHHTGHPPSDDLRAQVALARYHAFDKSRHIVQTIFDVFGNQAIYLQRSNLGKLLRDSITMHQHAVAQKKILSGIGSVLLNHPSDVMFV